MHRDSLFIGLLTSVQRILIDICEYSIIFPRLLEANSGSGAVGLQELNFIPGFRGKGQALPLSLRSTVSQLIIPKHHFTCLAPE